MHLFREWMRLFRECMPLFRGSKSAHQLSVHVRWESKDTPLGTNNQSKQLYHRLFNLKKRPRLGQNVPWIQVEPARDCLWCHSILLSSVCKPASCTVNEICFNTACKYIDIADLNVSLDTSCTPSIWYILDNLSANIDFALPDHHNLDTPPFWCQRPNIITLSWNDLWPASMTSHYSDTVELASLSNNSVSVAWSIESREIRS